MRTCSYPEDCGYCGDCDDGRCQFCGEEDICDGSGYNCPDEHYQEYNIHDGPGGTRHGSENEQHDVSRDTEALG